MTLKIFELKKMAKEKGIKYFSIMRKKELYDALGMELPEKPTKIELTDTAGKVLKFTSIYKASKELGINVGVFYNYTKRVKVGNVIYNVKIYNYIKKPK